MFISIFLLSKKKVRNKKNGGRKNDTRPISEIEKDYLFKLERYH